MNSIKNICINLTDIKRTSSVNNVKSFEYFVIGCILLTAIILGIQTFYTNPLLDIIDNILIGLYVIEFMIRCIACGSFFNVCKKGFLIFDFIIITACLIPEDLCSGPYISLLRIVRVFRIIRLLSINDNLKISLAVIVRSLGSITQTMFILLIFLYVFGIIGVHLFKMPVYDETTSHEQVQIFEDFKANSDGYFVGGKMDPYDNVFESMFTLFKTITGDDWTNLRNNQILASKLNIIPAPTWIITAFHVLSFVFGACILMNILVAAIIHYYETTSRKIKNNDEKKMLINELIKELENKGYIQKIDKSNNSTQ